MDFEPAIGGNALWMYLENTPNMAFDYILALLLACFILSANSRFIEEGAVGSDSFPIPTENIKETVPFKVVETKDAYEIRIYDAGAH